VANGSVDAVDPVTIYETVTSSVIIDTDTKKAPLPDPDGMHDKNDEFNEQIQVSAVRINFVCMDSH
jgi:hypothetical protein